MCFKINQTKSKDDPFLNLQYLTISKTSLCLFLFLSKFCEETNCYKCLNKTSCFDLNNDDRATILGSDRIAIYLFLESTFQDSRRQGHDRSINFEWESYTFPQCKTFPVWWWCNQRIFWGFEQRRQVDRVPTFWEISWQRFSKKKTSEGTDFFA